MDIFDKKVNSETLSDEEYALRKERGERAVELRKALKLTRKDIKKRHNLSSSTLHSWEDVNLGGMTESGAQRLASIYQAEGVKVSPEYLMYGIGEHPLASLNMGNYLRRKLPKETRYGHVAELSEASILKQELKLFYELHKKGVHLLVEDDAMAPWLMPGDYIGGKWYFDDEIKQAIGFPCIIQMDSGEKLVRILKAGSAKDCYTLICTNTKIPVVSDVKLLAVAPIIRLWKLKVAGDFISILSNQLHY